MTLEACDGTVRVRAAVAGIAACLVVAASVRPAAADPPLLGGETPVTVEEVGPLDDNDAVVVERAAGPVADELDGWRLNMVVGLENNGAEDVILEEVRIAYSGGSDPVNLTVDDEGILERVIRDDPDDPDDDHKVIPVGKEKNAFVPEDRVSPFPVPDQVTVEFKFEGFDDSVSVSRDLAEYAPPGGPYAFPFAVSDLADGEYISTGQNHSFGSRHSRSGSQQFAYDFRVRRWSGAKWTSGEDLPDDQEEQLEGDPDADPDGKVGDPDDVVDENVEFFIWDQPVYAIADGTVLRCFRGVPDNPKAGESHPDRNPDEDPDFAEEDRIPGGGNSFLIEHAPGEVTLYAHLKDGSVPAELCPDAADDLGRKYPSGVPGTDIKSGQFLGVVGNSGSSSGPHLHIHSQKGCEPLATSGIQTDKCFGEGRPLMYENIRVIDAGAFDPDEGEEPAWNDVGNAAVSTSPDPDVGGFTGYGQVDAMLIEPKRRSNLEVIKQDAGVAVAGEEHHYTITVTNHGPEAAPDATLIDHLPPEVDYVDDDGGCLVLGQELNCALGDLGPADAVQLGVTVAVPHDLVFQHGAPVLITNTATAQSVEFEATPEDNMVDRETLVIAVADLELLALEVVDPLPDQLLIGEVVELDLRMVLTNHGPSWPMDVRVETLVQSGGGLTLAPQGTSDVAGGVELGELRELEETFSVTCEEPGVQDASIAAEIRPENDFDQDPDASDNDAEVTIEVECVVPIAINIRPGNSHNNVNPGSHAVVPVAALTTAAGEYDLPVAFDAALIQASTVRFGDPDAVWAETGGAPPHGKVHVKDAHELDDHTKDGDPDMVLGFRSSEAGIAWGDTEACMKGHYEVGGQLYPFFGCDLVLTTP